MIGFTRDLRIFREDLQKEFAAYNKNKFTRDLFSGITVAAVALPLALAFGVASGADASAGLITAIAAAFIISFLSGASYQISGPTGAMTAILIPLVAKHGLETLFMATLLAGILLVCAGFFRLGKLVYFLPLPVVWGFTSGIAIIIAMGQLGNYFGIPVAGNSVLKQAASLFTGGFRPDIYSLIIGSFVIVLMIVWPKKWNGKIPGSLVAVIIATSLVVLLKLPVSTVGEIPATLIHHNRLTFASLKDLPQLNLILLPAISIAMLGMVESLLCGATGGRMKGERINGDRELFAQGIGNIILPFLGGVPATAAIARTSVAIKSGCETRLTGIMHGGVLLLSMFLLGPLMSKIPMASLAGILMVTAWRMNEWTSIRNLFDRKFKGGIFKYSITLLTTVVFDLTIAIAIGVLFSILIFLVHISKLEILISEVDQQRLAHGEGESRHIQVIYITGPIFFGSQDYLEMELKQASGDTRILSMRGVPFVDTSAATFFSEYCKVMEKEGIKVLFSSIQPTVKKMLDRAGVTDLIGEGSIYPNARDAIIDNLLE